MKKSTNISESIPVEKATAGASAGVVVSRAFGGRGYVIVDGLDVLRTALDRDGRADAVLEGTRRLLNLRRNTEGDLVENLTETV